MTRVFVNGEARHTAAATVADLIVELDLPAATILIELNGNALFRRDWSSATLAPDARIEILRVTAGG
jgi:thiazole synthase